MLDRIALFTQSLFSLPLEQAFRTAAQAGFNAVELACAEPHLTLELAREKGELVRSWARDAGVIIPVLSLYTDFVSPGRREVSLEQATAFIALAPAFGAEVVKVTPGPPASAVASAEQFAACAEGLRFCGECAKQVGVRVAFETHLNMLNDRLGPTQKLLDLAGSEWVGVNLDFCNLALGGDDPLEAIDALWPRVHLTHIKDAQVDGSQRRWVPLGTGMMDYLPILRRLKEKGYEGYLSIECLMPEAAEKPLEAISADLRWLECVLKELD